MTDGINNTTTAIAIPIPTESKSESGSDSEQSTAIWEANCRNGGGRATTSCDMIVTPSSPQRVTTTTTTTATATVLSNIKNEKEQTSMNNSTTNTTNNSTSRYIVRPPTNDSEARIIIIQITDVYTLENLASFKTLVNNVRQQASSYYTTNNHTEPIIKVICMVTGDFLAPYLLSTFDHGYSMMNTLMNIPIDYLTFGNHEADIPHDALCTHIETFYGHRCTNNSKSDTDTNTIGSTGTGSTTEGSTNGSNTQSTGKWLNSNMIDHMSMEFMYEYDIINISSNDNTNNRSIGLCAVLSNDPALYAARKIPAFGNATITDPWIALHKYQTILTKEKGCDIIIPLQHLYVKDDYKTCDDNTLHFPLLLSGHDHHRVDIIRNNTRLLKPGMDAIYCTIVEVSWNTCNNNNNNNNTSSSSSSGDTTSTGSETISIIQQQPTIDAQFVKCTNYTPDNELNESINNSYKILYPIRYTQLAPIPQNNTLFIPFTSVGTRERITSVGQYICTLLKKAMSYKINTNTTTTKTNTNKVIDACILCGGNIRANVDYSSSSTTSTTNKKHKLNYFSLEALQSEIRADDTITIISLPGYILSESIYYSHTIGPTPAYLQYDIGIQVNSSLLIDNEFTTLLPTTSTVDQNINEKISIGQQYVTHINNQPINLQQYYTIVTKISDKNMIHPLDTYFIINPSLLPPKGMYYNIHSIVLSYYARTVWQQLWNTISTTIINEGKQQQDQELIVPDDGNSSSTSTNSNMMIQLLFDSLDTKKDGIITYDEIQSAMKQYLQYTVDSNELTLAKFIHSYADINENGQVTIDDFILFAQQHCNFNSNSSTNTNSGTCSDNDDIFS